MSQTTRQPPKQADIVRYDSGMPETSDRTFARLACLASVVLFLISGAVSLAAFILFGFNWQAFAWVVILTLLVWVGTILYPIFRELQAAALTILSSLTSVAVSRAEAMEAAARGSDYTVTVEPQPEQPVAFVPVQGGSIIGDPALPAPDLTYRMMALPNGEQISGHRLSKFIERAFGEGIGIAREEWVGSSKMTRDEYDGVMDLLGVIGVVVDRRAGSKGRVVIDDPGRIKRILSLTHDHSLGDGRWDYGD